MTLCRRFQGSTFTEFSVLSLVFLANGATLFSNREAVKVRIEESSYSSSSSATSSDSSSESESAPRALMLSKSSLEVRAPSRVSEKEEGNGGAWSSEASLRLWIDDVAEADAECDGDGDCELLERTGAVRVRTVFVEAIASVPTASMLLLTFLDEILNHLSQANGAGLELIRGIFVAARLLTTGRLLPRQSPQKSRKLPLEKPLEPRLSHRLNRFISRRFFR
nr:hypothetical protein Iba_chr08dCG8550 [Ipomoea batatas]